MVGVFMGDNDGLDLVWVLAGGPHALNGFAAGKTSVDQDARSITGDDGAIAPAATGQHCHAHGHWMQNSGNACPAVVAKQLTVANPDMNGVPHPSRFFLRVGYGVRE